jgi:glucose/arabinose dehydrogenase
MKHAVLVSMLWLVLQTAAGYLPGLPLETITLPAGFSIALYARVPEARSMTLAPGVVFVGNRDQDSVYAVVDRDGDYRADDVIKVVDRLDMPNGVAFKDGSLYVAQVRAIVRYDGVLEFVNKAPAERKPLAPAVVTDRLPFQTRHDWKYLAFGPDGLLYVTVGAPCNVCDEGDPYGSIMRMRPDGTGTEVVARGVRNSVGLAWHPDTRELWFTDNGRDNLGDDIPPDELNHAPRTGLHFGFPYCHGGTLPDPYFGTRRPCSDFTPPARPLGSHVASLGLKFYAGQMFPPEYRKQIFIAEHGSYNRSTPIGYRVSVVHLEGNRAVKYETFAEGWLQGTKAWGRPVDVLEMPDGSLLVSDDRAGAIYRITYK